MIVATIASERLDLVSMSPEFMRASLAGDLAQAAAAIGAELPEDWPNRTARTMRYRLDQLATDPTVQPWLLRAMVLREPIRRVIGHIGFHAQPSAAGTLEVGYSVMEQFRQQGFAFEAVQALFAWAAHEHSIQAFVASIGPENAPSLALARKLGFEQVGSQMDAEDGLELVFELQARHLRNEIKQTNVCPIIQV